MPGFRFFVPVLPLFYLFIQEFFYAFRFKGTAVPTIAVAILLVAVNFYVSFSMIPRGPGKENLKAKSIPKPDTNLLPTNNKV